MSPAHHAGGVQEKLGYPGDIAPILAGPWSQQIIAADGLGLAIGEQRKRKIGLAA